MKPSNITQIDTGSLTEIQNTSHRIYEVKEEEETLLSSLDFSSVDQAVVNWLDEELNIFVIGSGNKKIKVPIEFATQERWFKALKEKGIRDKTGRILLPYISVRRTNEELEDIVLPRSKSNEIVISFTPTKERSSAYIGSRTTVRPNNQIVYDVYSIPIPIHCKIDYEINIQTSYVKQMNDIIMQIFENRGVKEKIFWLNSGNYRFMTRIESVADQSNIDDFSDDERVIKKAVTISTKAYMLPIIDNLPSQITHSRTSTRVNFMQETTLNDTTL